MVPLFSTRQFGSSQSLQKIGMCHILTSVRIRFPPKFCLDYPALVSPTSSRHRILSSNMFAFFDLPLCAYFSQKHTVPVIQVWSLYIKLSKIWLSQYNTKSTFDPWRHDWLHKGHPLHSRYSLACLKSSCKLFSRYLISINTSWSSSYWQVQNMFLLLFSTNKILKLHFLKSKKCACTHKIRIQGGF